MDEVISTAYNARILQWRYHICCHPTSLILLRPSPFEAYISQQRAFRLPLLSLSQTSHGSFHAVFLVFTSHRLWLWFSSIIVYGCSNHIFQNVPCISGSLKFYSDQFSGSQFDDININHRRLLSASGSTGEDYLDIIQPGLKITAGQRSLTGESYSLTFEISVSPIMLTVVDCVEVLSGYFLSCVHILYFREIL